METRKRRREPERPGTAKRRPGREWTALAAVLPTVVGIVFCMVFANVARLFL